jgi:hypothetical protein
MPSINSARQEEQDFSQDSEDFGCDECGLNCAAWESAPDFEVWTECGLCERCAARDRKEFEADVHASFFC